MGDKVLPIVIPTLVKSMESESPATRQGVCYGLKEVLGDDARVVGRQPDRDACCSGCACDTDDEVRSAASWVHVCSAFQAVWRQQSCRLSQAVGKTVDIRGNWYDNSIQRQACIAMSSTLARMI
jgi:hypothetical protein